MHKKKALSAAQGEQIHMVSDSDRSSCFWIYIKYSFISILAEQSVTGRYSIRVSTLYNNQGANQGSVCPSLITIIYVHYINVVAN